MVSVLLMFFQWSLTSGRVLPEIIAAGLWSLPLYLPFLFIVLFAIFSFNRDQQSIPSRNKSPGTFILGVTFEADWRPLLDAADC